MADRIDVTGVDLKLFVKTVYNLSKPQGMGFMHFTPEDMTDEEADAVLAVQRPNSRYPICLDYVKGRACKMNVARGEEGEEHKLFILSTWYDHSPFALKELLKVCNIKYEGELI